MTDEENVDYVITELDALLRRARAETPGHYSDALRGEVLALLLDAGNLLHLDKMELAIAHEILDGGNAKLSLVKLQQIIALPARD